MFSLQIVKNKILLSSWFVPTCKSIKYCISLYYQCFLACPNVFFSTLNQFQCWPCCLPTLPLVGGPKGPSQDNLCWAVSLTHWPEFPSCIVNICTIYTSNAVFFIAIWKTIVIYFWNKPMWSVFLCCFYHVLHYYVTEWERYTAENLLPQTDIKEKSKNLGLNPN